MQNTYTKFKALASSLSSANFAETTSLAGSPPSDTCRFSGHASPLATPSALLRPNANSTTGTSRQWPSLLCADWLPTCHSLTLPFASNIGTKRGVPLPRSSAPLFLPFLQHPSYGSDLVQDMKSIYKEFHHAVPFHAVPSFKVVHQRNSHVSGFLHNHRTTQNDWAQHVPPVCACHTLATRATGEHTHLVDGHLACCLSPQSSSPPSSSRAATAGTPSTPPSRSTFSPMSRPLTVGAPATYRTCASSGWRITHPSTGIRTNSAARQCLTLAPFTP